MDVIEKLLPSSSYTSILVIVDHLSKQSTLHSDSWYHYITSTAQLFVLNTSFPTTVSLPTSLLIMAQNSYPTSSSPSELQLDMKLHFTSGYIPKVMDKLNKRTRLWNSNLWVYCNCQTRQLVQTPSISLSSLTTILWVPLPALHPSLPTRVIIQTSQFILSVILHLHMPTTLSQTSMSYTSWLWHT